MSESKRDKNLLLSKETLRRMKVKTALQTGTPDKAEDAVHGKTSF